MTHATRDAIEHARDALDDAQSWLNEGGLTLSAPFQVRRFQAVRDELQKVLDAPEVPLDDIMADMAVAMEIAARFNPRKAPWIASIIRKHRELSA